MPIEGVDYSSARPDPQCLFQSGRRFAVRYTSIGGHAKNITPAEALSLTMAGLRIPIVFEESAGGMLGGAAAGARDAAEARNMALAAHLHERMPLYFALDVDPANFTAEQWKLCAAYLDAAGQVLGSKNMVGLYGNDQAIDRLRDHVGWLWQTYAWSEGNWRPGVHLQQYQNGVTLCGGAVDLTRAMVASYGQSGYYVRDGMDLKRALEFARSCDPIPYRMVPEVSRDGIDCSGFMSVLINSLLDKPNVWVRLFATGNIRDLVAGGHLPFLRTGLGDSGDFNIGVTFPWEMPSGVGHTAGTLGGVNVESRAGDGVVIGSAARGATHPLFLHHYHVKIDALNLIVPEEDDMPTAAEVKQAFIDAFASDEFNTALQKALAAKAAPGFVLVTAGDAAPEGARGIFALTPQGAVHLDNPTVFGRMTGGAKLDKSSAVLVDPDWLVANLAHENEPPPPLA